MTSVPSPAPPLQRSGLAKDASLVALETRAEAAERRARDAELRVVQLQEKATFLGEKADTAEAALKEQSSKLSTVAARIAQAEGRAEVLANQAKVATSALERAARAEERAAVLGDLQTKLPMLIRAVVDSVPVPPWHPSSAPGSTFHRGPIKLELEDASRATNDPYYALLDKSPGITQAVTPPGITRAVNSGRLRLSPALAPQFCAWEHLPPTPIKLELEDTSLVTNDPYYALLDRQSLGMAQAVTPREAAKEPQNQPEKTPPVGGQGGFMQRAMGAIAGSQRRNLKN
eukprot:CAMPEP_0115431124 /NCGR_PEP_ID=MMETSP0271-20121206/31406_1 /TAXON_ID=71861 /ORGANISM="Scrippsiella trochoidea, Strain CCMP3099" /LENGTH=287 /DNA_ID=CAMNT_0002856389 /DNA_START=15 /DNA_END=879 /DNA_ORIENTATION=-